MIRHAFFLVGPPGSGKGTVAAIAKQNGVTVISTRELLEKQGPDTLDKMRNGILAPDQQIIDLVENEITRARQSYMTIMIDTPRSLVQAKSLWRLLTRYRYHISSILMVIDSEEALRRILNRPQENQILIRDDDNIQIATKRIQDYSSYGPQIWSWLGDHTDAYEINNMNSREHVAEHVRKVIGLALNCTQEVHVPSHEKFLLRYYL